MINAINFVDWFSFLKVLVTAHGETMPLSEWCAQYACVQTNYVMTLAGIFSIVILLIRGNKKWWWYTFFAIFTITSITSVGMHTANYGEFQSGIITTKLVGSYVDMLFCLLIAWSGVCCFIFEFCDKKNIKPFTIMISCWSILTIITLSLEVFVFKDRPLFIFGGGRAMDGASGGFSIAEFCCFLTALPILPIFIYNAKKLDKIEVRHIIFIISIFFVAFIVSNVYGDNQINSFILGNLHTHSLYHILNGMGAYTVVFWVNYRTEKQKRNNIEESKEGLPKDNESNDDVEEKLKKNKKNFISWAICTLFVYLYILIEFILSIVAIIKVSTGFYSDFAFNQFQFLIISLILFVGAGIIGLISSLKTLNNYKIFKEYYSLYKSYQNK